MYMYIKFCKHFDYCLDLTQSSYDIYCWIVFPGGATVGADGYLGDQRFFYPGHQQTSASATHENWYVYSCTV